MTLRASSTAASGAASRVRVTALIDNQRAVDGLAQEP